MRTKNVIPALIAAVFGTTSTAFAASGAREDNSDFVVWAFLAFCALIVIGQLFPMVRNLRSVEKKGVEAEEAKEKA
jgi:hypothetical protein